MFENINFIIDVNLHIKWTMRLIQQVPKYEFHYIIYTKRSILKNINYYNFINIVIDNITDKYVYIIPPINLKKYIQKYEI